jgi:hypothetical protein
VRNNACFSPNCFFETLPDSMTSTTPGRRGSIEGTWLARIPMSPVAAAMLTWVASAEVKIAWFPVQRPLTRNQRRLEKPDGGGRGTILSCRQPLHSHGVPTRRILVRVERLRKGVRGRTLCSGVWSSRAGIRCVPSSVLATSSWRKGCGDWVGSPFVSAACPLATACIPTSDHLWWRA